MQSLYLSGDGVDAFAAGALLAIADDCLGSVFAVFHDHMAELVASLENTLEPNARTFHKHVEYTAWRCGNRCP